MAGFSYFKSKAGQSALLREPLELGASVTVVPGELLKFSSGKLVLVSAQTDKPDVVCNVDAESSATDGATVSGLDAMRGYGIWKTVFTPLYNDLVAVSGSGSSTTLVELVAAGVSSNALVGGLIWCKELNETRIITANTATSGGGAGTGNVIFTVTVPFSAAADGLTFRVVPFGFGTTALKLDSSNPHQGISNAIADITGGNVTVYDVDMAKKVAQVIFNP